MKKNFRVVQINGFRGLLLALFILSCLVAGFIAFPSLVAMHTWNYLAVKTGSFPVINIIGGILLWGIIALSSFILSSRRKFIVSFNSQQELTDAEVKEVLSKIKSKHSNIFVPKNINIDSEKEENSEIKTETKSN